MFHLFMEEKMGNRKNHRNEKFLYLLEEQKKSDLSQKEFCKRKRIKLSTFQYWKYIKPKQLPIPDFVKVDTIVQKSSNVSQSDNDFEITFNEKLSIKIRGCDFSSILSGLQEAGLC
jgi:hypothetical protein